MKVSITADCRCYTYILAVPISMNGTCYSILFHLSLTGDVQEVKSSFKQVVSLGIRNTVQFSGCCIALYSISPAMTQLLFVSAVLLTGLGSGMGRVLRSASRYAQDQVNCIFLSKSVNFGVCSYIFVQDSDETTMAHFCRLQVQQVWPKKC